MKRVLLTGGRGFIGTHCIPYLLDRGYETHVVTSSPEVPASTDVIWHRADLLNFGAAQMLMDTIKPSHLLHLAWHVDPATYRSSPSNYKWVEASLHLCQTFVQSGGLRIVVAGTCLEYDWRYGYCNEQITPVAPKSIYAKSKHALQLMLEVLAECNEVSTAWGRIFFTFGGGEHQDRVIPSTIIALLQNRVALCTSGQQLRDYLYVNDVAHALVATLDSDIQGCINVGSGQPVAMRDLLVYIGSVLGREHLIKLGGRPLGKDDPPLVMADISRLQSEVDWKAELSLWQGLEETIAWWQKRLYRL